MKSIIQLIQTAIYSDQNKFLGRWNITYCSSTINKKIDLANEDHCGTCYSTKYHNNQYINYMNTITPINTNNTIRYNKYITILNTIRYNKKSVKNNIKNPIMDLE